MQVITSNEQLMHYIPNAISSVAGETPLIDKLTPWLKESEEWLKENIIGSDVMASICDEPLSDIFNVICQVVVYDAFHDAVPSLDLVLTPNGFGIVSNSNIAPASKERVERLMDSLLTMRDKCIEALLVMLRSNSEWLETEQAAYFRSTLFPTMRICQILSVKEDRWQKYLALRDELLGIENEIEANFLSTELMNVFRHEEQMGVYADGHRQIVKSLQALEVSLLKATEYGKPLPCARTQLNDIVNIIRNDAVNFPEWHASSVKALFSPTIYENKKEDKGYWF